MGGSAGPSAHCQSRGVPAGHATDTKATGQRNQDCFDGERQFHN